MQTNHRLLIEPVVIPEIIEIPVGTEISRVQVGNLVSRFNGDLEIGLWLLNIRFIKSPYAGPGEHCVTGIGYDNDTNAQLDDFLAVQGGAWRKIESSTKTFITTQPITRTHNRTGQKIGLSKVQFFKIDFSQY